MHWLNATIGHTFKNKKCGKNMPLNMVHVLPAKVFHGIYKIHELCYIRSQWSMFRNSNNPKQCYGCQSFADANDICKFTFKWVKYAEITWLKTSTPQVRIPLCAKIVGKRILLSIESPTQSSQKSNISVFKTDVTKFSNYEIVNTKAKNSQNG